ncbi:MAG: 5-(carboxyamino)imidazole ribonucleotide mutase [Proteobacteria bacterium]|nr:5-(carboxyamino)imidazole ribonucleotide mutase [Pseudomonadota bacterium]
MSAPPVLLLAGSPSDLDRVLDCQETLESLGIQSRIRVLSAHRTPDQTADCVRSAESEGFRVLVAFAGLSAHLAGVSAAHTLLPVIAVPCAVGPLNGVDAALASLQMPPGTPVAAVALDSGTNGALLAARILALGDPELRQRLADRVERDRARYEPERIEAEIEKRRQARNGG